MRKALQKNKVDRSMEKGEGCMSSPAPKKAKLEDVSDNLATLPDPVRKVLVDIDSVQAEIDSLNEKASDEILKIEQKYNALRQPFYEKRSVHTKSIPNFWVQAILNHPQLNIIVAENEVQLLNCLINVEVEEADDIKRGFKFRFYFKPNDYFENERIEKEYSLGENPSSSVTAIRWKEGKNLADTEVDETVGLTFFQWLAHDADPNNDEIAELIKDDLWTNPVQYFLCPELEEVDDDYEEIADEEDGEEEEDGSEEN